MSDALDSLPLEELVVPTQPSESVSKIGTKEFNDVLGKELAEGKLWRSSKTIAEKLKVDCVELDRFLGAQPAVCCRASKDEGVFFYALLKRLDKETPTTAVDAKVESAMRPSVTPEDSYCLATLHSMYQLYSSALQRYAMKIHSLNPEAFTLLVGGKDKAEAGIALIATRLKADLSKLPKTSG